MQHWQLYLKWNTRLFEERYHHAYLKKIGKEAATNTDVDDPSSLTWYYEDQLKFFDDIVIPLAKKLNHCNLLTVVVADEYYACALSNRNEWQEKGRDIVTTQLVKSQSSVKYRRARKPPT